MSYFEPLRGDIDSNNSTTTLLGAGGVFTGTQTEIKDYSSIAIGVHSDVASATDGLSIEMSTDAVHWHWTDVYTISAGASKVFTIPPHLRYFRIVYTNGAVAQTDFELQVVLKGSEMTPSSHRIQDTISDDDDGQLIKAVLTGKANGTFENVRTTSDGDLKISDNSSGLSIAQGNVTGISFVHQFGEAPDFDDSDGEVTIWDGADDGLLGGGAMRYTYSSTADIDTISSSNNGDTQDIEVKGLDTNYNLVTQTVTLTGQTDATLGTSLVRVCRMINRGSTDIAGVVYLRTNGSTQTGGVPDTANTVRAIINGDNNRTEMCLFTVPDGKIGYMRAWFSSVAGAKKTSNYKIRIRERPDGEVFRLDHVSAIAEDGSSHILHDYVEPVKYPAKTDIEMTTQTTASPITEANIIGGFDLVLVDN